MKKLFVVFVLAAACLSHASAQTAKPLDVYFIDVEGGQATLFVTPSGESMLIDTGFPGNEDRDLNRILGTIKQAGLTRLDYLLVTHYHADHVGNAAAIASKIPVGTFIDHGETVETTPAAKALYDGYVKGRASGRHMLAKPGDKVPIRDLEVTIVAAGGEHIARPATGGRPQPNPLCADFKPKDPDPGENARSVASLIAFGRFRMADLGDLTWNKEQELACPNNLLGTVDVYLTTHHGVDQSGPPVLVHALTPRVAIMNNGAKKGGSAEAIRTVRSSPGLEGLWQLHYAVDAGADVNVAAPMIANLDESSSNYLKLSAQRDGSFSITNPRTKETRRYKAPNVEGRAAAFSDFRRETPGTMHHITLADLPAPFATRAVSNDATVVPRPAGALPKAMAGYTVSEYVSGLDNPRLIRTAPNGDVFVAESNPGRVKVIRGRKADGTPEVVSAYATGLNRPFGIAFYPLGPNPQWVYVGNTDSIVRFPYKTGDLVASGEPETIVKGVPAGGQLQGGGHWTRDIAFSPAGKMYIGVGSLTNVDDPDVNAQEKDRAVVIEFNPDGTGRRIYATGVRNAVGLAFHPKTGTLWVSVNERDDLGDNLVPDYITHIEDGGFYGWPWYFMGGTQDPRHAGKHPELKAKVITPDVLIQPHSASLEMVFHEGSAYAAEHGSWNRNLRTGYKVIRVPFNPDGTATGSYEDFVTGFVTEDGYVWGRPVGVTIAKDGALLVSDDGSNTIWRVARAGGRGGSGGR